jgi:SNF2 family DNA or RNA helicase
VNFYHDRRRNLLVYELPSPLHVGQLLQALPEAWQINGAHVAVPATLSNSQKLRWMQYPVAPVMTEDNYDWPFLPPNPGDKPYESQRITANFLVVHPRSFVLSDMGVGKTLATLWGADFIMRKSPGVRCLVVAPLSILERVWASAIFTNFFGKRTAEILHGSAEKRMHLLATSKADFLLINFDGVGIGAHTRKKFELDGFSRALEALRDIRVVIVDEASGYRDATTKRHRIARQVIGNRPYLWFLTGTPTPNAPTDAYGLAKLVNNAHGKSFRDFRMETEYQPFPNSFRWLPRKDGYEKARALLTPSIRFSIEDVWDGPPVTVQQREVELTAEQKRHLVDLKKNLSIVVKSGKQIDAINEAAVRTKFLQVLQGVIYDKDHKEHLIDAEPRLREIEAVVEGTERKIVIFVNLTSALHLLYKRLKRFNPVVLNGEVLPKDRSINIQRFEQDAQVKIVIADPQTTAHGINEFALVADTVIWASPTDKNELYLQGNKRVNRPGQKYPMTIVQIVSSKLEQEIYKRLETQTSMQGLLLDMVKRGEL